MKDEKQLKKLVEYPTVTVVIATYNSERTIEECLEQVRRQEYPQEKIDILLVDGGSTDSTFKIVKRFKSQIIHIDPKVQHAEYNKGFAVRKATGDLILMIDHDNIIPHTKWLSNMIRPLHEHSDVVGVETLRYHYDKKYALLDRYSALFGTGDPLSFYLGKADRLAYIYEKYNLLGKATEYSNYYIVEFKPNKVSTIGANGFLVRRDVLFKYAQIDEYHFYHTDVNVDLIKNGYNKFVFIKDDIIHLTSYKNISSFLYRRKLFMEQTHIQGNAMNTRRYSVFTPADRVNLIKYIFFSVTFVKPTYDALRGYTKIPDSAWFLHPYLSLALVVIFSYAVIKTQLKQYARKLFP